MLSYDQQWNAPHQDLLRQAYLLAGEPGHAERLAERAMGAAQQRARRYGPDAALEHAKEELVRSFLADPGPPRAPEPAGPAPHPDVAAWQSLRRLPPRRRAVLVLRYDEGLTEEQAADRMGTSEQAVRADVDAAMLTLRTALPGGEDPWTRVTAALAAAGRGWSDYTQPAPARVAEVLAAPRPEPRAERPQPSRSTRLRPVALAGTAAMLVLLAVAVVVPRLGDDAPPVTPAAAGVPVDGKVSARGSRLSVPTAPVAKGLLNWPPRGALAEDSKTVAAATSAWKAAVPAGEAPATGLTVLWAGKLDGRTSVLLQSLDAAARPRVAQVSGAAAGSLELTRAEPLHSGTSVLSLVAPTGPSGPVRVLVSPEGQVADGLLASDPMDGSDLTPTPVGTDGVSGVLPSPPGVPTCSRVVLLGLDPMNGGPVTGPPVLQSGIVRADLLAVMPMEVEVGTATLAATPDADPTTAWFADGARLAPKVAGKGTLTVAAFGPRVAARPLSATDQRSVSSRAYELRRGDRRWLGSVVDIDGKAVCSSVVPAGPPSTGPAGWVLRCPVPGGTAGVLHVVGTEGTTAIDVSLDPTPDPAGQRAFTGKAERDTQAQPNGSFATLQVVPTGFPCGAGTVRATGDGTSAAPVTLPLYRP